MDDGASWMMTLCDDGTDCAWQQSTQRVVVDHSWYDDWTRGQDDWMLLCAPRLEQFFAQRRSTLCAL